MRFLYLTPGCFDKGGISRYSRYQILALRQIFGQCNVRVLSLMGPNQDGFEEPFDVHWCGSSLPGRVTTLDRAALAARATALALTWKPDVVLSAHVNLGPLVTRISSLAGAQTVLNVYGLEIWSGLSSNRVKHMKRIDRIIADCHFTARYVQQKALHPEEPTVIWDPVDPSRFSPGPAGLEVVERYGLPDPAKNTIVMSLGRLTKSASHKGFDRLIRVIAPLCTEMEKLRLVIAGHGDDRLRLEELTISQGIADRVCFTGSVAEQDLTTLYRCADVFSLVSDRGHGRGEGIPLTPLEAMACGVPIIVGNEDGSQEAVINESNGFVISPRDLSEHRECLRRLTRDAELRSAMSAEARAAALNHFSFKGFVDKHAAFFAERACNSVSVCSSEP